MERREAFTFRTPTSIMIAGPSGCGKTVFTTNLLLENPDVFSTTPHTIRYCYGSWQHGFELLKQHGVQFHEGVPDSNLLPKWFPKGGILVLDNLMNEGSSDKNVLDLFTKDSHHQQITVIYLCQDLFPSGNFAKTISRNAHYILAFKNPRDQLGLQNLLQQSFPTQFREVLNTFRKVTNDRPFAYMLLDLHPASRDGQRILSHVLKDEAFMHCYQFRI